jgi:hypothetical protein
LEHQEILLLLILLKEMMAETEFNLVVLQAHKLLLAVVGLVLWEQMQFNQVQQIQMQVLVVQV